MTKWFGVFFFAIGTLLLVTDKLVYAQASILVSIFWMLMAILEQLESDHDR